MTTQIKGNATSTFGGNIDVPQIITDAPAFHATNNNTVQGIPNATFTKLILPEEIFDTNSNYDNATNYRFTPTVAGYYQFNSAVFFNNSATSGQVQIQVYKNGNSASFSGNAWNSFGHAWLSLSTLLYANGSTDYFELYAYQAGGSTQNTTNSSKGVFFTGTLLRADS